MVFRYIYLYTYSWFFPLATRLTSHVTWGGFRKYHRLYYRPSGAFRYHNRIFILHTILQLTLYDFTVYLSSTDEVGSLASSISYVKVSISNLFERIKAKILQGLMIFVMFTVAVLIIALFVLGGTMLVSGQMGFVQSQDNIVTYFYLVIATSVLSIVVPMIYYYCSSWSKKARKGSEDVMHYARHAKSFLKGLRDGGSGISVEYFIEDFLDHMKIMNLYERQETKKLWPKIEKMMLDDRRFLKTGKQTVEGGRQDCKYKCTQNVTQSYTNPTFSSSFSSANSRWLGGK